MLFNADTPLASVPTLPDVHTYPLVNWKYAPVGMVYDQTTDLVRAVIDQAPLTRDRKRILVDVKVQDLSPAITSCLPGWHLDGARDDVHHLFVHGGAPTEFLRDPVELPDLADNRALARLVDPNAPAVAIPLDTILTFTGRDFHRGVRAPRWLRRLLVRITETDTITGNTRPVDPAFGRITEGAHG